MFHDLFDKPVVARFDEPHATSDAGAILMKAADRRLGLIERLADRVPDDRQAGKIDHAIEELIAQRVFALASGYPDCNDAARVGSDPIHCRCGAFAAGRSSTGKPIEQPPEVGSAPPRAPTVWHRRRTSHSNRLAVCWRSFMNRAG